VNLQREHPDASGERTPQAHLEPISDAPADAVSRVLAPTCRP
jgi:hypothetical protein